jgi:hypothetical protein
MKTALIILFFSLISANSCKNTDAEETLQMNNSMPMENEVMQSMTKTTSMMNTAKMNGDFSYDHAPPNGNRYEPCRN